MLQGCLPHGPSKSLNLMALKHIFRAYLEQKSASIPQVQIPKWKPKDYLEELSVFATQ